MAFFFGSNLPNVITGTGDADQIFGRGGNDDIFGLGGADVIVAGNGNDEVEAGAGADVVLGGNGNDEILGQLGDDALFGNNGNDDLRGGNGDDLLDGGDGDDTLLGGADADILIGGDDADTFAFTALAQSAPGSVDTIIDFSRSEGDEIDLSGLNLDRTGPDRDIISFANFGGDRFLRVNTDNDNASEFVLKFEGPTLVGFQDLVL